MACAERSHAGSCMPTIEPWGVSLVSGFFSCMMCRLRSTAEHPCVNHSCTQRDTAPHNCHPSLHMLPLGFSYVHEDQTPDPTPFPVSFNTHRSAWPGWSCCCCCRPRLRGVYPRAPGSCETLPLCSRDSRCWPPRPCGCGSCSGLQQLPDWCGRCCCGFDSRLGLLWLRG
jgi:hypothetical protein